jgi:hypothetical protein
VGAARPTQIAMRPWGYDGGWLGTILDPLTSLDGKPYTIICMTQGRRSWVLRAPAPRQQRVAHRYAELPCVSSPLCWLDKEHEGSSVYALVDQPNSLRWIRGTANVSATRRELASVISHGRKETWWKWVSE